jgi:Tocopherol cyclase
MIVSLKPASDVVANYADNLCRWDQRSAGHYEVWFLTLNQRDARRGFWFRYCIDAPAAGPPRAALWAAAFDRADAAANLGLKRECAIDQLAIEGHKAFHIRIGDGQFTGSRAAGRVEQGGRSIEWDLRFQPNEQTYHHVTPMLINFMRPTSFVCSPNLDTRFTGAIRLDGRELRLEDEPGCQSHLWGRKHVDEWVWVHANAFEGHDGTVFEGLAARPRRIGRTLPPVQSLYLRHRGQEHRFTRLRLSEQWKRNLGMGYWSFTASNTRLHIEGVAQCRLRDMIQAEYRDPDGEALYCINSEVANLKIRLFQRVRGIRYRHVETINARATAHLEHAARLADTDVRMGFEPL